VSSIFILPKAIIVKTNSLLRSFLWKGGQLTSGGAKVAWEKICLPKEKGGSGVKILEVWN
jgi:hypothetical protein